MSRKRDAQTGECLADGSHDIRDDRQIGIPQFSAETQFPNDTRNAQQLLANVHASLAS